MPTHARVSLTSLESYVPPEHRTCMYQCIVFLNCCWQFHRFKSPISPSSGDKVEGKSRPHPASPPSPLHQVGLAGKHRRVVGHVVVRGEHFHLVLAGVDHKHDVLNGDAGLRNICGKDDLE